MAVFNPGVPSLEPLYSGIADALNKRADIASKDTGTLGAIASAAQPIADEAQLLHQYDLKKGLEAFHGAIQDELNRNQVMYQTQAAGKKRYTQDDIRKMVKQAYGDLPEKYIPDVGPEGIWATPEEIQALAEHGEYNAQAEKFAANFDKTDKQKADLIRLLSKDKNNTQYLAMIGGASKISYQVDANTGYHVPVNQFGQVVGPPLETQGLGVDDKGNIKQKDYTKLPPKMRLAVEKEKTKAEGDPQINKSVDQLALMDQLRDAVIQNNPTEIINIRARLGQAIGGLSGSRMASNLLQQEGFSKSLADQLEQWGTTKLTGQLSPTNQKFLVQQIDDTKKNLRNTLKNNVAAKAKDIQTASGNKLDDQTAMDLASSKAAPYLLPDIFIQSPDGTQTFRLKNRAKLQDYLAKGFKLVQQ